MRQDLLMLRRGWWIVALSVLLALSGALAWIYLSTPIYGAEVRLVVRPGGALVSGRDPQSLIASLDNPALIQTYAELLGSPRFAREAAGELQLDAATLAGYGVESEQLDDTALLRLAVDGPDPQLAARLADAIARRGGAYIQDLYLLHQLEPLAPAQESVALVSPLPARDLPFALAFGLLLGLLLALLRGILLAPLEAYGRRLQIDPVSSAFARRSFEQRFEELLASREQGTLSLALVQLDGLQNVIDNLPRRVVQRLLRHVTRTLQNELRGHDLVARWDEITFAVLLPATSASAAVRTVDRIRVALSDPVELGPDGAPIDLRPRAGIATREDAEPAGLLIEQVESALLRARRFDSRTALFGAAYEAAR